MSNDRRRKKRKRKHKRKAEKLRLEIAMGPPAMTGEFSVDARVGEEPGQVVVDVGLGMTQEMLVLELECI